MAANRADIFAKSFRVLKKHFKLIPAKERNVLDTWLFGCCLENNTYEKAEAAFDRIMDAGFDLNEIRVTTVAELAEHFRKVPNPRLSAANVKRVLQNVFESQYSFDLEHLKKQNLGKTVKHLSTFSGSSPFNISYLVQNALGGHSIPIDEGALEIMYVIGAINEKEKAKQSVPGLERAISKKQGPEYTSLLHQFSAMLSASPYSPEVKKILLEIAPDAQPRLPKRRKKKPEPVAEEKPAKPEVKPKAKETKKAEPAKKKATKKTEPAKKKVARKKPAAAAKKKKATKKPASKGAKKPTKKKKKKKSSTKQLSKRKPK